MTQREGDWLTLLTVKEGRVKKNAHYIYLRAELSHILDKRVRNQI